MKARLVLAILLASSRAGATCPLPEGAGADLASIDDRERLRFVRSVLAKEERAADQWTWAWAGTGVAFAGSGVVVGALATDSGDRTEAYYGAATSVLLPVFVFAFPLTARAHLDDDEPARDPCPALARAESRLEAVARDEALRTSGYAHAFGVVTSVLLALPLGLAWDRWRGFAVNAASSELVGIAQIGTTPTRSIHVLRRYRAGMLSDDPGPRWSVAALPGAWGVTVTLSR
jgi:hypothetical protein